MLGEGLAVTQTEVAALALLQPDGESSAERPGQVQELHQSRAGLLWWAVGPPQAAHHQEEHLVLWCHITWAQVSCDSAPFGNWELIRWPWIQLPCRRQQHQSVFAWSVPSHHLCVPWWRCSDTYDQIWVKNNRWSVPETLECATRLRCPWRQARCHQEIRHTDC